MDNFSGLKLMLAILAEKSTRTSKIPGSHSSIRSKTIRQDVQ
jgi:hypothetical protein